MDKAVQVVKAKKAGLSPAQRVAAAMIATGALDTEVAVEAKVAVSTVRTWKARPDFCDEINRCVDQLQRVVIRRASALLPLAIEAVEDVLKMPSSSATTTAKLQAAKIVFSRLPSNVLALEPAPDAPVPTAEELAERNTVPKATLLEVVRELRAIEESRRRLPAALPDVYYDDRDDDDEDQGDEQDDGRTIVGEVVHDVADEPGAHSIEPSPSPVVPTVSPAVGGTQVPEAEVLKMLTGRGGGGPFQSRRIGR